MNLSFNIARRLFGHRDDTRRISRPAVQIAMWGVAVGLAVMLISVCVVLGFKGEIRQKVIGFGGHIQVINYLSRQSAESQPIAADSALLRRLCDIPGVRHAQRYCDKMGMLKTDDAFKAVAFRGLGEECDTSFLAEHLIAGSLPYFTSDSLVKWQTPKDTILVSNLIAQELKLEVGQRVFAYFFTEGKPKARSCYIAGIYETHLKEFDNNLVFTDLFTARRLSSWAPDQCSGVELQIDDFDHLDDVALDVMASVNRTMDHYGQPYSAYSIRELHPSIFAWLDLLDTNVLVILVLMTALSLFTMTSGLLIIILERTGFIAVMKSLGASNRQLRLVFLHFGIMLIGRGMVLGNILGIGLALLQQHFGIVHLDPETYYVDAVPIQISWLYMLGINVATLLISILVLIVPTYLVARIEPARVMRFE